MPGFDILWRTTAQETFSAPRFKGERSTDLAILGGGFTGCSAALAAAGQGADVTLLEAETIGHGGSGRNVGLVNAGLWLPPDSVCGTLGAAAGERLNLALAAAPDEVFGLIDSFGIACEPVRHGTLQLAHAESGVRQLNKRHAQMARRGAPVELLDDTVARARTGSAAFGGGLFDPRAGTVQPLAYARGLARAAAETGAHLYENSRVLSAEHRGGRWVIRTETGKLRARALLVATNAYHENVAQLEMPRVPVVNFFQMATEPLSDNKARDILPGGEGCWDTGLIMTSVRRDRAGRVILGGMGDDSTLHGDWARRKLARLFPQIEECEIRHAWSGRISMTADHLPRILQIGPSGYAVFGYSGRGIAPGTLFGRCAARAILTGDETDLPIAPVREYSESFTGLKTLVFETGARVVHLAGARRR